MAFESPLIRSACVEATEFMDLARKYNVTSVPKTIVNNGSIEVLGARPEQEYVRAIVQPETGAHGGGAL